MKAPQKSLKKWGQQKWRTKVVSLVLKLVNDIYLVRLSLLLVMLNMQQQLELKEKALSQVNSLLPNLKRLLKKLKNIELIKAC